MPGYGVKICDVTVSILLSIIHFKVFSNTDLSSPSSPNTKLALIIIPRLWISLTAKLYFSNLFCTFETLDIELSFILSKPIKRLWQPPAFISSSSSGISATLRDTAAFHFTFKYFNSLINNIVHFGLPIKLSSINIICFLLTVLISFITSSIFLLI